MLIRYLKSTIDFKVFQGLTILSPPQAPGTVLFLSDLSLRGHKGYWHLMTTEGKERAVPSSCSQAAFVSVYVYHEALLTGV